MVGQMLMVYREVICAAIAHQGQLLPGCFALTLEKACLEAKPPVVSWTLPTYALFVNRGVVFMQPSKRVAFTAAMTTMAVFRHSSFALTLENAW